MKKTKILIIIMSCILMLIPIGVNFLVILKSHKFIFNENEISNKYDLAIVLGCGIINGEPSNMLRDRLNKAIILYNNNLVEKILITGEHSTGHSEVDVMENYLVKNDIPKNHIIRDDNGFSTSESLINYNENYKDKKGIIITQKYHIYRALYIAKELNLEVVGVPAEIIRYNGQFFREIREILARNKDFFKMILLKNPNIGKTQILDFYFKLNRAK